MKLLKSYCRLSGAPLAAIGGFAYAKLHTRVVLTEHPLCNFPLKELVKLAGLALRQEDAPDCKVLLCILADKFKIWDFVEPCQVDETECVKLLHCLMELAPDLLARTMTYPKLRIDRHTKKAQLAANLLVLADLLDGSIREMSTKDKLDWELELESALNNVLRKGGEYDAKLGKWAVQCAKDAEIRGKITADHTNNLQVCLDTVADYLRDTQLTAAINTALLVLPLDDQYDRASSAKVVRYLERKLELHARTLVEFDFADEAVAEGQVTGAQYTVKTVTNVMPTIQQSHKDIAKQQLQAQGIASPSTMQIMILATKLLKAEHSKS